MSKKIYSNALILTPDNTRVVYPSVQSCGANTALGCWYVPDPTGQGFSPYVYYGNNPLNMADPDGRFVWFALLGAAMGGYNGYQIGKAKGDNPWLYAIGGALLGSASGSLGSSIAAGNGLFSQTMSIAVSSYANSWGMSMLSGGMTGVSISFGFGSYNISNNEFDYLGKGGNSTLENIGYGLGAMSNLADINRAINSTQARLYTEQINEDNGILSHSAIVDENDPNNILMSYGPDDNKQPNTYLEYATNFRKSTSDFGVHYDLTVDINVNKYVFDMVRAVGTKLPYQGITFNCVNMASIPLWLNGIPNIGIHPYLLHATTWAYANGIRPDLLSYHLTNY